MNIKNLRVSAQLLIGFGIMMFLIILLGVISYKQSNEIQSQSETLFNHPLQVRTAIGDLENDILLMRLGNRNLMLASTKEEQNDAIMEMELANNDAQKQFNILKSAFLGPKSWVDSAYNDYVRWKIAREENTKLALAGNIEKVKQSVKPEGKVGVFREKMMARIDDIDKFAENKAASLYAESNNLVNRLDRDLVLIVLGFIIFSFVLIYILLRNLRTPIKELTSVTTRFREGDLNARSMLTQKNEFGELSASFNAMVENIQSNIELTTKTEQLTNSMLRVDDAHLFFRESLPVLAELTNSQMAAVYLLSDDKKYFVHYESIGMNEQATTQVFSANGLHGEFGASLSSHKIERIKQIPIDTKFTFQTVSGNVVPREIITIPIKSGKEIIALISLFSIRSYSDQANQLIDKSLNIITARIEGILSYRKIRKVSKLLTTTNQELEAQKNELTAQSTELTEQNRELEMQKKQLSEATRLKTNFLSNMSHELRTPLNSVIALSGVLNRRLVNKIQPEEYSYLEVIERNGKHLLDLINDILDISRIEAGKEEVNISKFIANDLITDLVNMIQPQAKQKNIALSYILSDNVHVTSDISKCRHILQNLIGNAVKFTEKGKVEVSVKQKNDVVEISVTDTGIGISEKHIEHIFDEFRQADGSTSRRYGGTGLGLAIAKKYTNFLGGTISVKSEVGKGSVFTVSLPINYSDDKVVVEKTENLWEFNPAPNRTTTKSTGQKTILLVDDSEPAIIQMKDFMLESQYKVLVAHDGNEALQIVSNITPDAIILDLMMPDVDGFAVLESIRNADETAAVPVLILTAKHITKEDLQNLKRNNIHQLIQKGDVSRTELLRAIDSVFLNEVSEKEKPKPIVQKIIGKPSVLIVEDNADNLTTVKAIIGDKFDLLEAIDGQQGIELTKTHKPHLILMDIALPGIDGIKAFQTIRQQGDLAHIPIIALTASAMLNDRETILAYGFDGYITKPIDAKEFFHTIEEVLYGK